MLLPVGTPNLKSSAKKPENGVDEEHGEIKEITIIDRNYKKSLHELPSTRIAEEAPSAGANKKFNMYGEVHQNRVINLYKKYVSKQKLTGTP